MTKVAIVGAGIVGAATAFELIRAGHDVTVFDPCPPGKGGPSFGNASQIAYGDIHPLSTPGIHWTALRMLRDADGPLKIPMRDLPGQIGWFWRFWRTSHQPAFGRAADALTELARTCVADTTAMFEAAGIGNKLMFDGVACVYDTARSFEASKSDWASKAAVGHESVPWGAAELHDQLPSLSPKFEYAVWQKSWGSVSDTLEVVEGVAEAARRKGVEFRQDAVSGIRDTGHGIELETDAGPFQADYCVVAAGVTSTRFAKLLGDRLPLAAERGYNLTFPNAGVDELKLPIVFADRGVVATQVTGGLRVGGWAEYINPDRPGNPSHFASLYRISKELFPDINTENALEWWGNRPSLPDSVPVISASAHSERVFYNCGHGHYGLTHSARSARLLSSLVAGTPDPTADMFSITRF